MIKRISAKLGNMRKPQDFIVYPASEGNPNIFKIQSDKRMCRFDASTGKGILSKHCPGGASSVHLTDFAGATAIQVPQEVIDAAQKARPQSGDSIGPGGAVRIA